MHLGPSRLQLVVDVLAELSVASRCDEVDGADDCDQTITASVIQS
jgi:hypothetical protein